MSLSALAVVACCASEFPFYIFVFVFLFIFFLLVFGFFHSAFAFVIKWNLARRLAALNASQCAAIFISFNAHTNRLRETAQGRRAERSVGVVGVLWWHLPDNGKVHTNKCNKMIGMSRLSMRHGVSLCCPSSQLPSLFPTGQAKAQPEKEQPSSSSSWSRCRTGVGNKALIKFHLCAPSSPVSSTRCAFRHASFQLGFGF